MTSKAGLAAAALVLLALRAAAQAPAEALSIDAKNPPKADKPLPGVASIDSADQVDALTQPLPPNAYYTIAFPLTGLSAVGVADGTPGLFWGTIPLTAVAAACKIMKSTGNHTLPVSVKAYDSVINTVLDVQQLKGCGEQGPTEITQATFVDSTARKSVMNCTQEIYPDGCGIFLLGNDVEKFYNTGLQAGGANSSTKGNSANAGGNNANVGGNSTNAGGGGGGGRKLLGMSAASSLGAPGRRLQAVAVSIMDEPYGTVNPSTPVPACSTDGAVVSGISTASSCTLAVLSGGLISPGGCVLGITKTALQGTCAGVHGGSSGGGDGGGGSSCFPAHATVQLCGAGTSRASAPGPWRRMDELHLGDEVVVGKAGGGVGCEPIYVWGHHDPRAFSWFVRLALSPAPSMRTGGGGGVATSPPSAAASSANSTASLELTAGHFVPVAGPSGQAVYKRAGEVRVGDVLWATADGGGQQRLVTSRVVTIDAVGGMGLFNPYTLGGTLVVDGALVSAHSEWFADSVFEGLGMASRLPAFYQAVLSPVRLMWHMFGAEAYLAVYRRLDAELDLARLGPEGGQGLTGALGFAYAVVRALAAFLVVLLTRCSPATLIRALAPLLPLAVVAWHGCAWVKSSKVA